MARRTRCVLPFRGCVASSLGLLVALAGCEPEGAAPPQLVAVALSRLPERPGYALMYPETEWPDSRDRLRSAETFGSRAALGVRLGALPDGSTVLVEAGDFATASVPLVVPLSDGAVADLRATLPGARVVDQRLAGERTEDGSAATPSEPTTRDKTGVPPEWLAWGSGWTSKGNCYRYAADDPLQNITEHHQEEPDNDHPTADLTNDAGGYDCAKLAAAAVRDGLRSGNDCAQAGCRYVALAVAKGTQPFMHWYRQDGPRSWSHKPGNTAVRGDDGAGKQIKDPYSPSCDHTYGGITYSICEKEKLCVCGTVDLDARDGVRLALDTDPPDAPEAAVSSKWVKTGTQVRSLDPYPTTVLLDAYQLELKKAVPTTEPKSARGTVEGLLDFDVSILDIGFEVSPIEACSAGAPRFNVETKDGQLHFFGCRYQPFTATTAVPPLAETEAGRTVTRMRVVFDEQGPGAGHTAVLHNIRVHKVYLPIDGPGTWEPPRP